MPVLKIDVFGGMAPIVNPRKLADSGAVVANWAKFEATDLRPWRDPVVIEYDTGAGTDMGPVGTRVTKLFRFSVMDAGGAFIARRWLAWQGLRAISPVASPIPADQFSRLYWTEQGGAMRVASSPTISQTLLGAAGVRNAGIPAPVVQPAGVPVDDSAAISAQPLSISKAKPAIVGLQMGHPFKEGQQLNIVITTPADAVVQNMRELSGKSFFAAAVDEDSLELRGSDTSNYSAFVDPSACVISVVLSASDFDDRVYVFTLVSDWGEEGPPSPPSDVVTVRKEGGSATVTLTWARPNGYDHITTARLYRTLSGQDGTQFFFVKDLPLVGGGPSTPVIVQFVDDVDPIALGELMPSTTWTAPVIGMFALVGMPNNFFIAAKGNTLYACVTNQPHAWPDEYRKTIETEIVGAAVMGQGAVIATSTRPYLVVGSDPASLTMQDLPIDAPCLNPNSIVSIGTGVVYASHDGLALITPAGARVLTQRVFSKQQWANLWTSSMKAEYHDGRYIAMTSNASFPTFSLRIEEAAGDMEYTTYPGLLGEAVAIDTSNDSLCYAGLDAGNAFRRLTRFDGGLSLHAYVWTSKVFTLAAPACFAAGKVLASSYPVELQVSAAKIIGNGSSGALTPIHTIFVASNAPFRLPSGFVAHDWQVAVGGTAEIQRIELATSIAELRAT